MAIYTIHNPENVPKVGYLLAKYNGFEEYLYQSVCLKYRVDPEKPPSLPASTPAAEANSGPSPAEAPTKSGATPPWRSRRQAARSAGADNGAQDDALMLDGDKEVDDEDDYDPFSEAVPPPKRRDPYSEGAMIEIDYLLLGGRSGFFDNKIDKTDKQASGIPVTAELNDAMVVDDDDDKTEFGDKSEADDMKTNHGSDTEAEDAAETEGPQKPCENVAETEEPAGGATVVIEGSPESHRPDAAMSPEAEGANLESTDLEILATAFHEAKSNIEVAPKDDAEDVAREEGAEDVTREADISTSGADLVQGSLGTAESLAALGKMFGSVDAASSGSQSESGSSSASSKDADSVDGGAARDGGEAEVTAELTHEALASVAVAEVVDEAASVAASDAASDAGLGKALAAAHAQTTEGRETSSTAPVAVPAQLSREALERQVFDALSAGGSGTLDSAAMRRFASLNGFEGTDEEWNEEYEDMCEEWECDSSIGFSEATFIRWVNDDSDRGMFVKDRELAVIASKLLKQEAVHGRLRERSRSRSPRAPASAEKRLASSATSADPRRAARRDRH